MEFNVLKYTSLVIEGKMTTGDEKNKELVPILYRKDVNNLLKNYSADNSEYFLNIKEIVLSRLGELFAKRRDRVRWIDKYGYDCASEDITNFLAAYIKLEKEHSKWLMTDQNTEKPTTLHKVYINKETMEKAVININFDTMDKVYSIVRDSQFEDYGWHYEYSNRINNCKNIADLNAICKELEISIL